MVSIEPQDFSLETFASVMPLPLPILNWLLFQETQKSRSSSQLSSPSASAVATRERAHI